jgi:hypothetical protein
MYRNDRGWLSSIGLQAIIRRRDLLGSIVLHTVLWLGIAPWRARLTSNRAIVVSAFWIFLATVLLSEWIYLPQAFDQTEYIRYTKNFPEMLLTGQFAMNAVARWGPSGLCWLICKLLFIPLTDSNIMRVFESFVIIWGTTGALLWTRIADRLGVRDRGKWLGFILLYVNLGAIKYNVYMPIMTDATAFLIALAQLYFYLSKQSWALIGVTLFGAFTFPGLEVIGLLLYILPAGGLHPLPPHSPVDGARSWILSCSNLLVASALALATAALIYLALQPRVPELSVYEHVIRDLVPLSVAAAILYVFLSIVHLLRCDWWTPLRALTYRRLAIGCLLLAGVWIVRLATAHGYSYASQTLGFEPNPYLEYPSWALRQAGIFPLSFAWSSLRWFGLGMLFIYCYWKPATEIMQKHGLPIVAIAGLATFMHFDTTTRHLQQVYPIMIAFSVAAADRTFHRWSALIPLTVIAVLQSRVWASINPESVPSPETWAERYYSVLVPYWPQSTIAAATIPIGSIVCGVALVYLWRLAAARNDNGRCADEMWRGAHPIPPPPQSERPHS